MQVTGQFQLFRNDCSSYCSASLANHKCVLSLASAIVVCHMVIVCPFDMYSVQYVLTGVMPSLPNLIPLTLAQP